MITVNAYQKKLIDCYKSKIREDRETLVEWENASKRTVD